MQQIVPQEGNKNCQSTKYNKKQCVLTGNVKLPSVTRKLTKMVKQPICS